MSVDRASWLVLVTMLAASPVVAQQDTARTCNQTNPGADFRRVRNARGEETIFISGPARFVCTGGVEVEADSAVWRRTTGAMELLGNVLYRDTAQALTSDWANYLSSRSALYARGSVVFRDLANGSEVRGERLEYLQESDDRPVSRAVVQGGRPHAVLRPASDTAVADTAAPIEVDADWMEFVGDSLFTARDEVEILRDETRAYGAYAEYDQGRERLMLRDSARVVNPEYRLRGDRIDALFAGGDLAEVWAQGHADLDSEDLVIRAPRMVIGFTEGELETLSAWVPFQGDPIVDPVRADTALEARVAMLEAPGEARDTAAAVPDTMLEGPPVRPRPDSAAAPRGAPAMPDSTPERMAPGPAPSQGAPSRADRRPRMEGVRAVAVAEGFRLEADSIRAMAPGQVMERVTAVGGAFGHRTTDSLDLALPGTISRDWVEGDTIIGFFSSRRDTVVGPPGEPGDPVPLRVPSRPAPPDSAADRTPEQALERVVVVGQPARSLYRLRQEGPDAPEAPGVNYMTASRITLHLVDGDVSRVDADGPIEGIYLDPQRRAVTPDTVPADTVPELPPDTVPPPARGAS